MIALLVAFLEASLLRPLGLVVAAWLMLRLFHVRHPASRHAVWTAVLVGMLLLPIVSVVVPRWTLAVLPSRPDLSQPVVTQPSTPPVERRDVAADAAAPAVTAEPSPDVAAPAFVWPALETLVLVGYLTGVFVMTLYRVMGWLLLRGVVARSRSTRLSCVRESVDIVAPVAVGILRPSVLLPDGWRHWNQRTKRAVLAHEFAHLRRGDTLVSGLGRFVTSVLWFHPAAWWVSRKTSELAELASDAVALQRVGDPASYSRVLLEFAKAVSSAGRRVTLPGLAIASGSRMNDRVDQVFEMSKGTMRRLTRPRVWLPVIGLPVMALLATVMLGAQGSPQTGGPKFEVVSIKPCPGIEVRPPGSGRGANPRAPQISPGYVHWGCVALAELIEQAYTGKNSHLLNTVALPGPDSPKRVRGGPSWVESERFTIEARVTGDTTDLTGAARFVMVRDAMMPALRAMIEDQFELKLHKATEQQSMYALAVAAGGINKDKMTTPVPGGCWEAVPGRGRGAPPGFEGKPVCGFAHGTRSRGNRRIEYSSLTLTDFARELSGLMGRFVIDQTNIAGKFDFAIEYAPDDNTPGDRPDPAREAERLAEMAAAGIPPDPKPDGPTIFKVLETLGLKLQPVKGPSEYLVIDHVARPKPSEPSFATTTPGKAGGAEVTASRVYETPDSGPAAIVQNAAGAGVPQQAAPLTAKFDVVSIKPCPGDGPPEGNRGTGGGSQISPGSARWNCVTIDWLIRAAYVDTVNPLLNNPSGGGADLTQLLRGAPSWIHADRFAIEAKAAGNVDRETMRGPMLRAMLEDRFGLKIHKATETAPMYVLTVAKTGLNKDKVKPTAAGECWAFVPGTPRTPPPGFEDKPACGNVHGMWSTVPDRSRPGDNRILEYTGARLGQPGFLSGMLDRPVLNQTGLNPDAMYTFVLEFTPDERTAGRFGEARGAARGGGPAPAGGTAPGSGLSIFKALETLGLKLELGKGPREYLVIDHIERPTPNGPEPVPPARATGAGVR
ncbi:MAG TPA: TIGR03435 family protein [Vicinamibacterales bacterium]|nr:TIGR03435 family protein [Vicinamibacterales bacterium]